MDDARVGRSLRVLRHSRGLRQLDVAARARVGQATISRLEAGHLRSHSIAVIREVFAAVDAGVRLEVLWRGGELDRLLDAAHADLVASIARLLASTRWNVAIEVTFSRYGERGSIDVLALMPGERVALVVEVKSALTSIEETARRLDAKVRLAPAIVAERAGWRPTNVGALLVLPDTSTARRQVAAHSPLLDGFLPDRGRTVRRWVTDPGGRLRGIAFLPGIHGADARRLGTGRVRVGASHARAIERGPGRGRARKPV